MFPDSAIAKSYKQGGTKVKYCSQCGITPHLKDLIVKDLANSPFTFKFDETTTSQVKKQYDTHVQFWSEKENRVVIAYCGHGSLFVSHCTAEDLVSHFNEFGIRIKWDPKYLLHIGMDGPNVNLSFEKKWLADFERKYSTKFPKLGSWSPLHHVHNTFRKALQKLDIDTTSLPAIYIFSLGCQVQDERGFYCLGRSD